MTVQETVRISREHLVPGAAVFTRIAKVLEGGGLLAYPAETVYGLGCSALRPDAVRRVLRLKSAPSPRPFIVLVPSWGWVARLTAAGGLALALARRFWPGPLTLVLDADPTAPSWIQAADSTIAVRHSPGVFVRCLFGSFDRPLVSSSANPEGLPPAVTAAAVGRYFEEHEETIDILVDSPEEMTGVPSTIVSLSGGRVKVLREGRIPGEAIRRALEEEAP